MGKNLVKVQVLREMLKPSWSVLIIIYEKVWNLSIGQILPSISEYFQIYILVSNKM